MLIFGGLNSGTSGTFQSTNAAVNGSKVTMTQEKLLKTKLAELSFQISSRCCHQADHDKLLTRRLDYGARVIVRRKLHAPGSVR